MYSWYGVGMKSDHNKSKKELMDELESLRSRLSEYESGSLYRQIADSTFEAIFLSKEGICIGQNKTAERMFGFTEKEAIGREGIEWIYPDFRQQVTENMRSGFEGTYDSVALRKDGTTFPCEVQGRISFHKGKPIRITALRDISKRSATIQALKESELRFKALHNASFGGIAIHDKGIILDCNQGLEDIGGYTSEELIGMDGLLLIAEGSRKQVMDNILAGYEKPYESVGLRKNGEEYPIRLEARGIPYKGKDIRVVEFRDISSRKRAEQALAESEAKYRALFDEAIDPILVADPETGRIIECNHTAEEYFGIPRHKLVGMHQNQLHPKEFQTSGKTKSFRKHLKSPDVTQELTLKAAGGEMRLVSVKASHLSLGDKPVIMGVFRDVTEQRRSEEALIAAKEEAEKANKTKTQFLANMSHEIRTPLNGVMGMLQLLEATEQSAEQQEYSVIAIESCKRLTQLLSDILDVSRIEAGKLVVQKAPVNLEGVVKRVATLFQATSRKANVELKTVLDPQLPCNIVGDPARLQQVLTNLVGNSFKFTRQGHVSLELSLLPQLSANKYRVLFMVSDTGEGIDDETLGTLFTPFTQGDASLTRPYEGAGLGLSICRQLVDLMGGDLAVESEPGKGTSVYFTVLFDVDEKVQPMTMGMQNVGKDSIEKKFHILIAEDVPVNQLAISRLLEKQGHLVTSVDNGFQAIEALNANRYDLVLMDVQMPVMDGVVATKAIRSGGAGEQNRDIPIIALTAHAMSGDRINFLKAGMDDYLAKPVDAMELYKTLARQMSGKPES